MWWIYVIGAIVLLLVVLIVRALNYKPEEVIKKNTEKVEVNEEEITNHFSKFIQCKTVTIPEPEKGDYSEHEKFISLLQELYPRVFEKAEFERINKYGLYFKFKGKNEGDAIILMSHFDVVTYTKERWSVEPFGGEIKDGKVWGRGAIDNKATLLCPMESMENILKNDPDFTPEYDLYFTFGGDEECNGICQPKIVEKLQADGVRARLVLDEGGAIVKGVFPGSDDYIAVIGLCEKGMANVEVSVDSTGGHASQPSNDDPVNVLTRAINKIESNPMEGVITSPVKGMLDVLGRNSNFKMKLVFANMWLFKGLVKKIFSKGKATNALIRTTFAFTELSGSKAPNVLPSEAKVNINIRIAPNTNIDEVVAHIKKVVNDDRVKINVAIAENPSPVASIDSFGYKLVKQTMNDVYDDVIVSPYVMLAASDSRHYTPISDCVLKFAPFKVTQKQLDGIHGDDENIDISALKHGVEFYTKLIKNA